MIRRTSNRGNAPKIEVIKIETPKFVQANLWRDTAGNWRNISMNMWMSDDDKELATEGITQIASSRLRDFARSHRKPGMCNWYTDTFAKMKDFIDLSIADGVKFKHISLNRIQRPMKQAYGYGKSVYENTAVLFVEPAYKDPFAMMFVNDQAYSITFNKKVTPKQAVKGGVAWGESE